MLLATGKATHSRSGADSVYQGQCTVEPEWVKGILGISEDEKSCTWQTDGCDKGVSTNHGKHKPLWKREMSAIQTKPTHNIQNHHNMKSFENILENICFTLPSLDQ